MLLTALLVAACGSERDTAVIDFSKTVPVARPGDRAPANPPLRVAVAAMISPKETFDIYRQLLSYVAQHTNQPLEFVQRKTYSEINDLLDKGLIDVAFICSGPYVTGRERFGFTLVAVPEVNGSHYYQSYLIVNQASPFQRLEDLRGRTFAFTDPDSNTGKMVPTFWLAEQRERPETFFSRVIYTYSHDNSIMAVSRGLVDGAAVDGLIWEYYQKERPDFTSRTRIIKKSALYGIPPLVASRHLSPDSRERLQKLLFAMHQEPEGRKILKGLMIDRFVPPQEEWYESLRQLHQQLAQQLAQMNDAAHAPDQP